MTEKPNKKLKKFLERSQARAEGTADLAEIEETDRARRKKKALQDYAYFCQTYFPHFCKSPTAAFQLEAAKVLAENEYRFYAMEWFRGAAKSAHFGMMVPMWLMIRGELKVMLYVSDTEEKAIRLLAPLREELKTNQRFAADWGEQYNPGEWSESEFVTQQGVAFFVCGKRQSPRGTRYRNNRPDYILLDDIDDDQQCRNETLVNEAVDWIFSALFGCMDAGRGRIVMVGNLIHPKSILAKFKKRPNTYHKQVNILDENGLPSWPENHSLEEIQNLRAAQGLVYFEREYMNRPIVEGKIWKENMIVFCEPPALEKFQCLVLYGDPAFSNGSKGDFKAWSFWGKLIDPETKKAEYYFLKAYLQNASQPVWIRWAFDFWESLPEMVRARTHVVVEGFVNQGNVKSAFELMGMQIGKKLPVKIDDEKTKNRKRGNKQKRIMMSAPFWENGQVFYNEDERNNADMIRNIEQQLAFDPGRTRDPDDGPDCNEGALKFLERIKAGSGYSRWERSEQISDLKTQSERKIRREMKLSFNKRNKKVF